MKNPSGSHLHIVCLHIFPGDIIVRLYSPSTFHLDTLKIFSSFYFLLNSSWEYVYTLELLLWGTHFSAMIFLRSIWGSQDISIFTGFKYNYNHEIRKSAFFWLVPFDVGILLLATGACCSGRPSLETSNSLKILVFFSWGKAKTWRHTYLKS